MSQEKQVKGIGVDLTQGEIFPQLIRFVLPLLLANFVQQLYNTVDMMVIGQFVGSVGSNAVSNGGQVATLITFIATAFGSAVQIYVSQLYGAKNHRAIKETLSTSLLLMMGMSLVFTALCLVLCAQMLGWINCPQEALAQARVYMLIATLGLPAIFGYNVVCGALRGMVEAKRPLLSITVAAVSNVILDLLLVAVVPLGVAGTAIATVAAQYCSFAAATIYLYRRRSLFDLELSRKSMKIYKVHLSALLKLGIPLTAQTTLIHVSLLICTSLINAFGMVASTTNNIGNNITKMANIFTSSINQGAGAMMGQNIGAKKYHRIKKILYVTLVCSLVCSAAASLLVLMLPRETYGLFLSRADENYEAITELGAIYLRYHVIVFMLAAVQGAYQSIVTGTGNAKLGMVAGLLDGVILRLGFSFLLAYTLNMGVEGFFLANGLARLGPIIVGTAYYYSGKWENYNLLKGAEEETALEEKLEEEL